MRIQLLLVLMLLYSFYKDTILNPMCDPLSWAFKFHLLNLPLTTPNLPISPQPFPLRLIPLTASGRSMLVLLIDYNLTYRLNNFHLRHALLYILRLVHIYKQVWYVVTVHGKPNATLIQADHVTVVI